MNVSMYQAAAAMNANSRWQEVIAENIGASSVPGFKRQDYSFSAVQAGVLQGTAASNPQTAPLVYLPQGSIQTVFAQGQVTPTGDPNSLALEGSGFFEIQLPSGEIAYTRDGGFATNAQGLLVNKQGFPLMGEKGPIQTNPKNPARLQITEDGTVSQGAEVVGKIKVTDFARTEGLTVLGGGLFQVPDPVQAGEQPSTAVVKQGCLEAANTTPTTEMVNMISAMRAYEANQRIITTTDERMGSAIRDLAGPA